MKKEQIYLVHGYQDNPNSNCFPWLRRQTEKYFGSVMHVFAYAQF